MSESGPVEVEAQGVRRTVSGRGQPQNARLRIDEAANQPGRGQPVHPRAAASGPGPALVLGQGASRDTHLQAMRLARRQLLLDGGFQLLQGRLRLFLAGAGEEVDGGDAGQSLAQPPPLFQPLCGVVRVQAKQLFLNVLSQLLIVCIALKQRRKMAAVQRAAGQQARDAAVLLDIGGDGLELLQAGVADGQQIGSIAQRGGAASFQGAPGAHARGGVFGGQGSDQQQPVHDVLHFFVAYSTFNVVINIFLVGLAGRDNFCPRLVDNAKRTLRDGRRR